MTEGKWRTQTLKKVMYSLSVTTTVWSFSFPPFVKCGAGKARTLVYHADNMDPISNHKHKESLKHSFLGSCLTDSRGKQ